MKAAFWSLIFAFFVLQTNWLASQAVWADSLNQGIGSNKLAYQPEKPLYKPDFSRFSLGIDVDTKNGAGLHPLIREVEPNSAAYQAGLRSGCALVSVDGEIAAFMGIDQLHTVLTGKEDCSQKIEYMPAESAKKSKTIKIKRLALAQFQNSNLARRLADDRKIYPERLVPLTGGFAPIDLPTFLRKLASEGPAVIEFYLKEPDRNLNKRVAVTNKLLSQSQLETADGEPPTAPIGIISIKIDDPATRPLRRHFRIDKAPAYIFVGFEGDTIKDYVDVVRHQIDDADLEAELNEIALLQGRKLSGLPLLYPNLAQRWKTITNREIDLAK
ncbi:MAG: hypothetical protein K2Y32_06460 [Candidatus Obscuribacterales bacterium]|nr:hypothetical protein [Candidatus Obscuribacterales bacterium]